MVVKCGTVTRLTGLDIVARRRYSAHRSTLKIALGLSHSLPLSIVERSGKIQQWKLELIGSLRQSMQLNLLLVRAFPLGQASLNIRYHQVLAILFVNQNLYNYR